MAEPVRLSVKRRPTTLLSRAGHGYNPERGFITEALMKACLTSSLLATLLALMLVPVQAQQGVPDLPFDSVPDFLKLPPGTNFGEVSGVAVNSKGHVFVFTRSNSAHGPAYAPTAAQLLEFGPKGEFIQGDWQRPVRLVVRPHRAHRQERQHLGGGQRLGHDHQVRPDRPGARGLRAAEGIGRR